MVLQSSLRWFSHCLIILLIPCLTMGDTLISGSVSGSWKPNGNKYIATGAVFIEPGNTLEIYPGVIIEFDTSEPFCIYGELIAIGDEGDSIYFTSGTDLNWEGIWFMPGSSEVCILDYVSISVPQWGVVIDSSTPTIQHSLIQAVSVGIDARWSEFNARDCVIKAASGQAEAVRLDESDAVIQNCKLYATSSIPIFNAIGVRATRSNPEVLYSEIHVDGEGGSRGFFLQNVNKGEFSYNLVHAKSKNQAYGFLLNHCDSPYIINNTIAVESNLSSDKCIYLWNNSNPLVVNCILYGDYSSQGIVAQVGCNPFIIYTDIYNHTDNYVGCSLGPGCLLLDPEFVDAENGNYNLTGHSPCINSGCPESPLDPDGTIADMGCFYYWMPTAVEPSGQSLPVNFNLIVAFPNPFNAHTTIQFNLPTEQTGDLNIYNQSGQLVQTLKTGEFLPGEHSFRWDGSRFSSGMYWVILKTDHATSLHQLTLLK